MSLTSGGTSDVWSKPPSIVTGMALCRHGKEYEERDTQGFA